MKARRQFTVSASEPVNGEPFQGRWEWRSPSGASVGALAPVLDDKRGAPFDDRGECYAFGALWCVAVVYGIARTIPKTSTVILILMLIFGVAFSWRPEVWRHGVAPSSQRQPATLMRLTPAARGASERSTGTSRSRAT